MLASETVNRCPPLLNSGHEVKRRKGISAKTESPGVHSTLRDAVASGKLQSWRRAAGLRHQGLGLFVEAQNLLACSHRSNPKRHRLANIIDAEKSTVAVAVPVTSFSNPPTGGSNADPR